MRLHRNLRQEDMESAGISIKHYQDLESGKANPTYLTLLKLADVFKCSIADFIK